MHGINKVQLIGNVGRDPQTKYLDSGVPVTTFSFATSETHRKRATELLQQNGIILCYGEA